MNNNAKKKLKSELPRGWSGIIPKLCGFSKQYVVRVINGKASNVEIEAAAIELAEKNRVKKQKISDYEQSTRRTTR